MKRIIALLTVLTLIFSMTSVFAADSDNFFAEYNPDYRNANLKMTVSLIPSEATAERFGMPETAASSLFTIGYDMDITTNEEGTKAAAGGKISVESTPLGIPESPADIWVNADVTNPDMLQLYIILGSLDKLIPEAGSKYVYLDYTKINGFTEMINASISNAEQFIDGMDDGYTPTIIHEMLSKHATVENGTATVKLSEAALKEILLPYINLTLESIDDTVSAEMPEVKKLLRELFELNLFDSENAMTLSMSKEAMHMELNIDFNLADILTVIDPSYPAYAEDEQIRIAFSVLADAEMTQLPDDYAIEMPELTNENSIDIISSMLYSFAPEEAAAAPDSPITVSYNNSVISFKNEPLIVNDRTFVPFRELANSFGISDEYIGYDEATERVTLNNGEIEIVMYIGSAAATVNGELKMLDVPAFTHNDRTYIPARFVSEMFGKQVNYSEDGRNISVMIND